MDLLLGFDSLDSNLPLPVYSSQFDANSIEFHRSCSDPGVRPIVNEDHGDGGIWMDASSCISQSTWQQHDPFVYSFAFDDILLAPEFQPSPGDTHLTMFTTSSDATDSPASGNGKLEVDRYLTSADGGTEWDAYIPASLSSPMRALEFFQHSHTTPLSITTNEISSNVFLRASNAPLTGHEDTRNSQVELATMVPSFVSLGVVESRGPGSNAMSGVMCSPLLDFEASPLALSDGISSFEPVSMKYLLSDAPVPASEAVPGSTFKAPSLHGWSEPDVLIQPAKAREPASHPTSKATGGKQRRPPILPHAFIPIKPPTRSTAHTQPPIRVDIPKPGPPVQAAGPSIPESPSIMHETDTQQSLRASESDDYLPSPSPSFSAVRSSSPVSVFRVSPSPRRVPKTSTKRKARRGRGKAKGSAALALAVVTQLGTSTNDDVDPVTLYQEGKLDMLGIRKRKNHPIPLPIPVPNLNKKSRGRKVPYVAPEGDDGQAEENAPSPASGFFDAIGELDRAELASAHQKTLLEDDSYGVSTRGRRRGSVSSIPPVDPLADKRTYVCDVAGCGKCFVRGEHLKRHIRSIHTYEKPHTCPYEGCDKSFSRRDNLGQHVRIHLQP